MKFIYPVKSTLERRKVTFDEQATIKCFAVLCCFALAFSIFVNISICRFGEQPISTELFIYYHSMLDANISGMHSIELHQFDTAISSFMGI